MSDSKFRINIDNNPEYENDPSACPVIFSKDPSQGSSSGYYPASLDGDSGSLTINKKKGASVKLSFRLQDGVLDGYVFKDSAESFSATSAADGAAGEFAIVNVKDDNRTLVVEDKNDDGNTWNYTLTVFNPLSKEKPSIPLDPTIKNTSMA